jgi:hypothetical protein
LGWIAALIVALGFAVSGATAQEPQVRPRNLLAAKGEDPGEKPGGPVVIVAARNGSFSGKVAVNGATALKAVAGDLRAGAAVISAANIQVRYGVPWAADFGRSRVAGEDVLLEAPPAEIPAEIPAEVEVWITVNVPKDAKAAVYQGAVNLAGTAVPLQVDVQDWTLPDTQDYRTWVDIIQSPDTLALEYDVPLWSEKHWELIGKSFQIMSPSGCRILYVPLICRTNSGNSESLVQWIKKGEDTYEYDFSRMEKYLDVAKKHLGRPKMVVFQAWDVYLKPPEGPVVVNEGDSRHVKMEKEKAAARWELREKGPAVTMTDGEKVEAVYLPRYADPKSRAIWKPLWDELRKKMTVRGLEDTMALGMLSDLWPSKEEIQFLDELSGGLPWASHAHNGLIVNGRAKLRGFTNIAYDANVWSFQWIVDPSKTRLYGWKQPVVTAVYHRFTFFNKASGTALRNLMEQNITGSQRGVGRIGGDTWPALRNSRGTRAGAVTNRYAESYWHSLNIGAWLLAPGPNGPVGTARYEHFREGVQECQARIAIEQVLTDPTLKSRLGDDLAGRAQALLDERQGDIWKGLGMADVFSAAEQDGMVNGMRSYAGLGALRADRRKYKVAAGHYWTVDGHKWFVTSGWQDKTRKLFALAGEVEKKLAN